MTDIYFGGIEGGASRSTAVIYNGLGSKVSEASGLGTNHWMCGMEECQHRIFTLIQECKMNANIPIKQPLAALGLSLSGCEQEATNTELKNSLKKSYPFLSKTYYVCSDTIAPIAAANEKGGIVVISGTGSNALLMNPDGSVIQSGGWGHLLGDEGSAYWVAWKAVKIVYDEADGFVDPPNNYSTAVIWELIKSYFNIQSRFDILPYLYANFEKAKVAGLCKEIAQAAATGDPLSKWLFQEAGHLLARFVLALAAKSDSLYRDNPQNKTEAVFDDEHGLRIVCVGSMWKSWEYIQVGFHAELETNTKKYTMKRLALLNLTVKVAVGAVYLAAKSINYDLPRNYKDNFSVFYQYKRRQ